ncbi:PREDICTED: uncharacterized protein LOC109183330 [Ipomoea nil]|uniref:uncharacterized protein LOC109183330 n=1 Tax=Ipomoea nil TaxID=35883 RepID=UPI0009012CA7|nr:PREDICTED: uncharacterized protein LOC109183330 [Ipomoea nil]
MHAPADLPSAPGAPPDGDPARTFKRFRGSKRSFADAVTAATAIPEPGDDAMVEADNDGWLSEEILAALEKEMVPPENPLGLPVVTFSKELRKEIVQPWRNALTLKFLGKRIAFNLLLNRLSRMWNTEGKFQLIDLGYNWYVARFDRAKDCMNALVGGPYKVFNHYVVPQRWTPRFNPAKATVEKMTVWVRLPGLLVELFRNDTIKKILRQVGTPVKLDRTTTGVDQGHFERAAVEVDLKKPLTSMIIVEDWIQQVEFEGLHTICFYCGEVGHRSNVCPKNKQVVADQTEQQAASPMEQTETTVNTPPEPAPEMWRYGQWMIVQNKHANQGKTKQEVPSQGDAKRKREGTITIS